MFNAIIGLAGDGGGGGHLESVESSGSKVWLLMSLSQSKQNYRCPVAKSRNIVNKAVGTYLELQGCESEAVRTTNLCEEGRWYR